MSFKSSVNTVVSYVKDVKANLPAIRKDVVSAVTSAASVVALAQTFAPQVSGGHQAAFAAVAGFLSGVLTFFTRDDVVDEINKLSQG